MAANQPAAQGTSFRATGPAYIATIAIGHGLKHWYIAAFAVLLPLIEEEYALSTFAVGLLGTIRQFAGGAPNFFVGYVSDRLRNYWNLLLPISFLAAAGSMMLAGLMPWYWMVVLFISCGGISAAFWHPPAISMLSHRFPGRRGMAIAFHGSGSGAGEALAPLIVGIILVQLLANDWRQYTLLSMIPALGIAALIWWMLRGSGQQAPPADTRPPNPTDVFTLLRYPVYRTLAYANFTRSFAYFGVLHFLSLYVTRDLAMGLDFAGGNVALLAIGGVIAGPIFGHYSDRIGRRSLIVTGMIFMTFGMLLVGITGSGIPMLIGLAAAGVFLWSIQDVMNAAAMDAAPKGREGSVVGMMFSSSLLAGIIAPLVMSLFIELFDGRRAIFFVSAAVTFPSIFVLAVAPMYRKPD